MIKTKEIPRTAKKSQSQKVKWWSLGLGSGKEGIFV